MVRVVRVCAGLAALLGSALPCCALSFRYAMEPIRVTVQPGQVVNRSFWLTLADNEKPARFKARAEDWWRSADGKQSFYRPAGTLKRSCAPWVKLNPVEAAVQPGETVNIRVTITAPEDAKPGGYWCALTLDEVPDPLAPALQGTGMRFLASVSVGIYASVAPLERKARITGIGILPDRAEITLCNEGNCPLAVEGRFEFVPPGAKEPLAVVPLSREVLLPEPVDTATYSAALPDAAKLPSGRYLVRAILDVGLDHYIGAQKEIEVTRGTPNGQAPR